MTAVSTGAVRAHASTALGARIWVALVSVGLMGQLAWTVENMYLNVFVYDTISDNPTVIAAMVAASALTATLATLLFGAISDRLGRRRVFIAGGYLLWGLSTMAFGLISVEGFEQFAPIADAIVLTGIAVILLDCVMSFFGSSANDAAFMAWVTDVTSAANRGRVEAVLAALPLLSILIVFGTVDGFASRGDWPTFFVIVGTAIIAVGILAWFLVRDVAGIRLHNDGVFRSIVYGLRPGVVRANPRLYLAFLVVLVLGIASQIFLPYLLIYIQRYLKIEEYARVLGIVLLGAAALSVLGGRVIDRVGKLAFLGPAVVLYAIGLVLMFYARDTTFVIVAGIVMMAGFMLSVAAIGAAVRDYTPLDRAGAVQGIRMLFAVLLPMLTGPFIGAAVIRSANEYYEDLGVMKQVPTPGIFLAAAFMVLVVLIPVWFLRKAAQ
ncbi:MFS transporter [Glaciibacter psychrotolerans]|uniref:MFS family permease n=1 Tax=Glaciibacter psychrotolerans TaxID=670054 RepID=A0A7Z0EE20_9MICO|nr:MFS transporter [Leifsonia psychrotolerans]NYJ19961.1 MFS family permease [Leifsonia psychrotolerans]